MKRQDLEHVIAAAANIVAEDEFVVIGSQAILGSYPDAPAPLLGSMEADIYPARAPEKAIEVDGSLGDGSQFHRTFAYYAHGIGPETAKAPAGWQERLIRVPIPPRMLSKRHPVALCLEPHDLVLAKRRGASATGTTHVPRCITSSSDSTNCWLASRCSPFRASAKSRFGPGSSPSQPQNAIVESICGRGFLSLPLLAAHEPAHLIR